MPSAPKLHTILVTDDNAAGRYATCRMLEAAGFATVESAGGASTLELAKEGIDAIVLDVHLPDVHGFAVCRLLRAHPATARLPVVHVSAVQIAPEDHVGGFAAGADAYYVSPVEPSVLAATLAALIRAREQAEAVWHSERRYRDAFERAPTAMALIDGEGRIADANAALFALLECTAADILQRPLALLVPPDWTFAVEHARLGWAKGPWTGQFPIVTPSGARIRLAWACVPQTEAGWVLATATQLDVAAAPSLPD